LLELVVLQFGGLLFCEHYLQGNELWYWPKKIAALKESKILFNECLFQDDTAHLALSVDGVNFAAREKKHATLNKDPAYYNHKHNHCDYKYEIAFEVYFDQIAWIKGLSEYGKGDHDVFQEDGLQEKMGSTPGSPSKERKKQSFC
jgi:hypothetical protein